LTASQAFLALGLFLEEFAKRFKPDAALATLLTDVRIGKDLMSNDPAALPDWAECVEAVVSGEERRVEADARPLTPAERNVLLALLSEEFPGRDALLDQVTSLTVRSIDREGSLELKASGPKADVKARIPVEAVMEDQDGFLIHILLHVCEGLLNELEIYKDNLGVPQREVNPDSFKLIVH
jgi:hypothetical protein